MKYIRTKDGIVDLSEVTIGENGWKNIEEYIAFKQEEQKELIKVADTIEELCDEFVVKDNDCYVCYLLSDEYRCCIQCHEREELKTLVNDLKMQNETCYGAIWTDKGLVYVAKMNEKGELKLL